MRYLVGYQMLPDNRLVDSILKWKDDISEVYFSWGQAPSGRSIVGLQQSQMPWENIALQRKQLQELSKAGIGINLLLNANCYGDESLSRSFYQKTGDLIDYLRNEMSLSSVTTTSPILADFIHNNFSGIEVRASVNMEIESVEAMEYLKDTMDGFYYKRELNRNIPAVRRLREWCNAHGKKLYMLANSGCLSFCPARQFHDNLVAHEQGIARMDNAFEFKSLCRQHLKDEDERRWFLSRSNWVRPEDLSAFEGLVDGAKLATRIASNPMEIIDAYLSGSYVGNILELTEPNYAGLFYPEVLSNKRFPKDYFSRTSNCDRNCRNCGYCRETFEYVRERISQNTAIFENKLEEEKREC